MNYTDEVERLVSTMQEIASEKSQIPDYFIDIFKNSQKQNSSSKRKKVGVIGDEFYSLYVSAFGLIPVIITGGSYYLGENASDIFPQISDPVAKSTFGLLLEDNSKLLSELSAIIISTTNDSYKKALYYFKHLDIEIIQVETPSFLLTKMPTSYILQETRLISKISKISNTKFSASKLKKELLHYKEAYKLMESEKWKCIPTIVQSFLTQTLYIDDDKACWCSEVQKYLFSIEDDANDPFLLLIGSSIKFPNSKMYEIFSEVGISHFTDKSLNLPQFQNIPMKDISFSLLNECFKFQYKNRFNARTLTNAKDYKFPEDTKGIVYYLLKGQTSEAYQAEQIEKAAIIQNIPYLCVETDYTDTDKEQIKIRVEAFYEMLRSKANKLARSVS